MDGDEWEDGGESVDWEMDYRGPWRPGLDRGVGEVPEYDMGTGALWRCPVCNHGDRDRLNRELVGGRRAETVAGWLGVGAEAVKRHLEHHAWPIYASVGVAKGMLEVGDGWMVDGGWKEKVVGHLTAVEEGRDVAAARMGRPWSRDQENREVAKVVVETINFYDEMMEIRRKANRVYDEVMAEGDLKFYPTAIAAVREMRGVVEVMGKMSLIAKRLGESDGTGQKRLSASLAGMIDEVKGTARKVEEEADEIGRMNDGDDELEERANVELGMRKVVAE